MVKFVELTDAAKILGVSSDELVEMRGAGEIHGYRDGSSWKFKVDEVDRVLAERGDTGSGDESDESVLVSEEALGHSGESTSSTIIGKNGNEQDADSDLALSSGQGSDLSIAADSGSELDLGPAELPLDGGSSIDGDVTLVPGVSGGSDVSLIPDPGSDRELANAGTDLNLNEASSGALSGDLDGLDDELALSDDDDLVLSSGSDSGSDLSLSSADSGIDLSSPSDSGLSLESDSGISLQSPTDSGLSLEDDAVAGSSISSLELPEDEQIVLEEIDGDTPAVQQDEQFMLSPSDEMFADESDSGSQVIALEDSEAFDQESLGEAGMDEDGLDTQLDGLGGELSAPVMAPTARGGELAEAPYSVWNIMGFVLIMFFLMLTGMLMMDIIGNMWAWEDGRDVSTSIAEGITSAFGL